MCNCCFIVRPKTLLLFYCTHKTLSGYSIFYVTIQLCNFFELIRNFMFDMSSDKKRQELLLFSCTPQTFSWYFYTFFRPQRWDGRIFARILLLDDSGYDSEFVYRLKEKTCWYVNSDLLYNWKRKCYVWDFLIWNFDT